MKTVLINKIRSAAVMTRCNATRWEFKANGAIFAVIERAENGVYFAHRLNARAEQCGNFMAAVASLLAVYAAEYAKETAINNLLGSMEKLESDAASLTNEEKESYIIATLDCTVGYVVGWKTCPVELKSASRFASVHTAQAAAEKETARRNTYIAPVKLGDAYKKAIANIEKLVYTLMTK